jgi:hypothetical protein
MRARLSGPFRQPRNTLHQFVGIAAIIGRPSVFRPSSRVVGATRRRGDEAPAARDADDGPPAAFGRRGPAS